MIKKKCFLLLVSIVLSVPIMQAQITNSSMSGRITDADGAVAGAVIVITHKPSGTTYATVSNRNGRYNLSGMRVGGPYTVEISSIGHGKNTTSGITLQLGEAYVHNVVLTEKTVTSNEEAVSAKRTKLSSEKTGATTNFSTEDIVSMPNIDRSISNIARKSPYTNGASNSGDNGRSISVTIDGANFNNNFGLSSALSDRSNTVSIDAIEEVQVIIAPFDVRQTNFIDGGLNAITKSGTNKFKGSAYAYFINQDMCGNKIGDVDLGEKDKYFNTIYGVTLGGPIIKNKLFFFINAESEKTLDQVVSWRASDNGAANIEQSISRTHSDDMEKVKQHLKSTYGYDTGSYTDYSKDSENIKILARIDWNISNKNKLSLRYNYTKNQLWNPTNGNSTDAGYRFRGYDRISEYSMAFANSIYLIDKIVNSFSLDLNSRFTEKISNSFLITYSKIQDMQNSPSSPFPFIDILKGKNIDGTQILEPYIATGYELYSWSTGAKNNILTITDNLKYYFNNHRITGGVSLDYQIAKNSYMKNGTGYYRYASIDDFLNQAAPIDFALTYGYESDKKPIAEVTFNQIGIYIQDEWNVNPALNYHMAFVLIIWNIKTMLLETIQYMRWTLVVKELIQVKDSKPEYNSRHA